MFKSIDLGLQEIFADPIRRSVFFRGIAQDEIASQIRARRKERGLTQSQFATLADMKQSAVSRIEHADYAAWTLTTLFRVAEALDARWKIVLEPIEIAVKEYVSEADDNDDQPIGDAAKAAADAALPSQDSFSLGALTAREDDRFKSGASQ